MTTRLEVARFFMRSDEAQANRVRAAYSQLLGRPASDAEVNPWLPTLRNDPAYKEMWATILASEEFWLDSGLSPQAWVQSLYLKALNRPADPEGAAFWLSMLLTLPPAAQASPISLAGAGGVVWQAEEARNEALIAAGTKARVVFLGDSILDWLATGDGSVVWQQSFAPLGCVDLAISGLTTAEVVWQVEKQQVAAFSPQGVVLMIGTNNLGLYHHSPTDVAEATAVIVETLLDSQPALKVLVLGVLPRDFVHTPIRQAIADTNNRVQELVSGLGASFVDLGAGFLLPSGQLNPNYYRDGVLHPSLAGYAGPLRTPIWQWVHDVAVG